MNWIHWPYGKPIPQRGDKLDAGELGIAVVMEVEIPWRQRRIDIRRGDDHIGYAMMAEPAIVRFELFQKEPSPI